MYMTSQAAQYWFAGRMWPVGRRLESPVIDVLSSNNNTEKEGVQNNFGHDYLEC